MEKAMAEVKKRKKSAKTLLKEIEKTSKALYEEQFDEDTVPVDMGDVVRLLCVITEYLKESSEVKGAKTK